MAQDAIVDIDFGAVRHTVAPSFLGINVNYIVDEDLHRDSGSRPLSDALKEMGIKRLRYPGGEKSDNYLWSTAPWDTSRPTIPRKQEYPAAWAFDGGGKQVKDLMDFDEFMALARKVGAEPVLVICYDAMAKFAGTNVTKDSLLRTAVEWVRYANVKRKYGIKTWEIGNELWTTSKELAAEYGRDVAVFAKAMKEVDPSIHIIANGVHFFPWWQDLLTASGKDLYGISVPEYPCWQWKSYERYRTSDNMVLAQQENEAINAINKYMPVTDRNRLRLGVVELNASDFSAGGWPQINNMGHALVVFDIFGQLLSNPRIDFACFWNTRWIPLDSSRQIWFALDNRNTFTPEGRVISIWGKSLKGRMVQAVSTNPFVVPYASASTDGRYLEVPLINKDLVSHPVRVKIKGYSAAKMVSVWRLKGNGNPDDTTVVWAPTDDAAVADGMVSLTLDPVSITVLSFDNSNPVNSGAAERKRKRSMVSRHGQVRVDAAARIVQDTPIPHATKWMSPSF